MKFKLLSVYAIERRIKQMAAHHYHNKTKGKYRLACKARKGQALTDQEMNKLCIF